MRVPVGLRIALLVIFTCLLYSYVGQLVPQKEVAPPEEVLISPDATTEEMVGIGEILAKGKGMCLTCHTIGRTGALRFPDLSGIAASAATRRAGVSQIEYLAETLYEPDIFVVEGFNTGMPKTNRPPIGLSHQEILCVLAWLQTLGGEPTVTLETSHAYYTPVPVPVPVPVSVPVTETEEP
jgi:mono/diheme cytochrome c family protein